MLAEPIEQLEAFAKCGGTLELERLAGTGHGGAGRLLGFFILSVQESTGRMHAFAVGDPRACRKARPQASADFMAQAPGRTRDGKQFLLVGEHHFLRPRAVPQAEMIVKSAYHLRQSFAGVERPKTSQDARGGQARQEQLRGRLTAHADVSWPLARWLAAAR